ncbi:malectin domain-containing carbohydrate-binding protein [Hymenobacter volaticus]|uniref:Malectin domain-containing carbohydrate-binding protein n=1 Tax=Hymenobacter volaticus TaxID=2932254 RepID=A0ABY4GF69_9BACT|nr:malectin domain-containing carbohydrate-binding protein [Hymenobacter volaticus]UOQ69497.1 malectin domain-containing carbohydrate-binding protein [Hymenobacter volaticus]
MWVCQSGASSPSVPPQPVTQAWLARSSAQYADQRDMEVDAAGNTYVTGSVKVDDFTLDYLTSKYSPSGQLLWQKSYNGVSPTRSTDEPVALAVDAVGNVYVTGTAWIYTGGYLTGTRYDYVTIKYSPTGEQLWVARYDRNNTDEEAADIAVDAAGNVYVLGTTGYASDGYAIQTVKYSATGQLLWTSSDLRISGDHATHMALNATGDVYVVGNSVSDGIVRKYSGATGKQLWSALSPSSTEGNSQFADLAVDAAGNVVVIGTFNTGKFGTDPGKNYYTAKYASATGQRLWTASYDGPANNFDQAAALALDAADNVYVTGHSYNGNAFSTSDYATLKYDANGQQQWVARYNGPSKLGDAATALTLDQTGNVYVTGRTEVPGPNGLGSANNYDYGTVKYSASGQQVWEAKYGTTGVWDDKARTIRVAASGKVQVSGYSTTGCCEGNQLTVQYDQQTTPAPTTARYRIHAGGEQVTTSLGTFAADQYATGGTTFATDQPIAGTTEDALYQTERYGTQFGYAFPVSRGQQYQVVLHFAEVYATQAGQRVFDVALEGNTVLDNYDLYRKVGAYTATTERFTVTVADDELNLDFSSLASAGGVDNAKVSAIEVYGPSTTPTTPTAVLRLKAGSGQLSTSMGTFAADQYATGGSVFATDQPIAGTADEALYQTERYGSFTYNLPVPNGTYTVKLHFAELYWNSAGQRVFNVAAEGSPVLTAYDIVKKAGPLTATTESFPVTVTDGQLILAFAPGAGGVDQPKVSAIEVLEATPTAVLRLKAGGDALNTSLGRFAADQFFAGGSDFVTDQPIAGTQDDALYQSERYGSFLYSLPVPNGTYTVKLHFAELYWDAPGQRVFDVAAEGTTVLKAYDIVQKVGPLTATTESFSVTVTDGVLSLAFAPGPPGWISRRCRPSKCSAAALLYRRRAPLAARWRPLRRPSCRSIAPR